MMRSTVIAALIATTFTASPAQSYDGAIADYAGVAVAELMTSREAYMAVTRDATKKYSLSGMQEIAFLACLKGAARDPVLKRDRVSNAASACRTIAKRSY